jgi:hypothetical protein
LRLPAEQRVTKPASRFFNSASAQSFDLVEALHILSDALYAPAAKAVEQGREGEPGIPLDQGAGKT